MKRKLNMYIDHQHQHTSQLLDHVKMWTRYRLSSGRSRRSISLCI